MSSTARDLVRRDRLRMREIEAQAVGRDQRALLRDMRAERLAQRRVEEMRRRVVGADRAAPRRVDRQPHRLAGHEAADLHLAEVHEEAVGLLLRVGDAEARAVLRFDRAGVADLAAGLAVERRLVDDDRALVALVERLRLRAVLDQRQHRRLGALGVVAEELGRAEPVAQLEPHALGRRIARARPARARLRALPLHGVVEAGRDRRRCRAPSARPASGRAGSRRCRRA